MPELTHLQTASAWAALHARRNMRKKAFKWAVALCAGLTLVAAWTDSAAGARLTFRMVLPFLALYFGAAAFDQGTVFFKRFDQLEYAAHVVVASLAQAFEFFINDHGAYAIMHIDL